MSEITGDMIRDTYYRMIAMGMEEPYITLGNCRYIYSEIDEKIWLYKVDEWNVDTMGDTLYIPDCITHLDTDFLEKVEGITKIVANGVKSIEEFNKFVGSSGKPTFDNSVQELVFPELQVITTGLITSSIKRLVLSKRLIKIEPYAFEDVKLEHGLDFDYIKNLRHRSFFSLEAPFIHIKNVEGLTDSSLDVPNLRIDRVDKYFTSGKWYMIENPNKWIESVKKINKISKK